MLKKLFKIAILIGLILVVMNYKSFIKIVFPTHYSENVKKYAKQYNLDEYLVYSIIKVESNFNPDAKSRKGASGLMQITPETGGYIAKLLNESDFSQEDLFSPKTNVKFGCFYISKLYRDFNGDINCVLAAYNGGEGNVRKWLNSYEHMNGKLNIENVPFNETKNYIKRVKLVYNIYKYIYK